MTQVNLNYVKDPVTSKLPKIFVLVLILQNDDVDLKYVSDVRKFLKLYKETLIIYLHLSNHIL